YLFHPVVNGGHILMIARLLVLLAVLCSAEPALAQLTTIQRADVGPYQNMVINPGFENGAYDWTATAGATFSITTTAANVGEGTSSASWSASASNKFLTSAQVTIPSALLGGRCNV